VNRDSPAAATLLATGLFIGGVLAGTLAGNKAVARAQDPYANLDIFVRVLDLIERDYVEEIDEERLIHAAISGMLDELDAQSRWLDPEQSQDLLDETQGTSTGLGIELDMNPSGFQVEKVLPGSPALRDGVESGDTLLEIDGDPLEGLDPHVATQKLSGPRGETAVLTILRDGWTQPRQVHTVFDQIHVPSVDSALLADRIAYIHLSQFQEGSAREVEVALDNLADQVGGLTALGGLILDLRDNPGGLLTQAVAVSDLFLDEGLVVSTRGRSPSHGDAILEEHAATAGAIPPELDVICLVNGMSASASEIVAGALQDTGRGTLVGEPTYGKGTVQKLYKHVQQGKAALKLTVGTYYTPSGEPVASGEGRAPDHEVLYPRRHSVLDELDERLSALSLTDAERASLREVTDEISLPPPPPRDIPWDTPVSERLPEDPQLQRALSLLLD
jgi:carboxyl-terminal processing protease